MNEKTELGAYDRIKQLEAKNEQLRKGFEQEILRVLEINKQLEKDSEILRALEAGGVDNWEWYGVSMEEIWEEENE